MHTLLLNHWRIVFAHAATVATSISTLLPTFRITHPIIVILLLVTLELQVRLQVELGWWLLRLRVVIAPLLRRNLLCRHLAFVQRLRIGLLLAFLIALHHPCCEMMTRPILKSSTNRNILLKRLSKECSLPNNDGTHLSIRRVVARTIRIIAFSPLARHQLARALVTGGFARFVAVSCNCTSSGVTLTARSALHHITPQARAALQSNDRALRNLCIRAPEVRMH